MRGKEPWYHQFWILWLAVTLGYWVFDILLGHSPVTTVLGLFVPIAIWNTVQYSKILHDTSSVFIACLPYILVALSLIYVDKISKKFKIKSIAQKVLFNFVWLCLLTVIIDYIVWGRWDSLSSGFF
jgi:hypothetical protein